MTDSMIIMETIDNWEYVSEQQLMNKIKSLSIDKIRDIGKGFQSDIKRIEAKLKYHGVDVDDIKKDSKLVAKSFKKVKGNTKTDGKEFASKLHNVVSKHIEKIKGENILEGVKFGVIAMILLVCIQTVVMVMIGVILTPLVIAGLTPTAVAPIMMFMTACIVAPITEEYLKKEAIKRGVPYTATMVFAGLEFISYIMAPQMRAISLGGQLLLRVPAIIMHVFTTYIQKKTYEEGGKTKEASILGYKYGVAIHAIYNLFALIFNSNLMRIASAM